MLSEIDIPSHHTWVASLYPPSVLGITQHSDNKDAQNITGCHLPSKPSNCILYFLHFIISVISSMRTFFGISVVPQEAETDRLRPGGGGEVA